MSANLTQPKGCVNFAFAPMIEKNSTYLSDATLELGRGGGRPSDCDDKAGRRRRLGNIGQAFSIRAETDTVSILPPSFLAFPLSFT